MNPTRQSLRLLSAALLVFVAAFMAVPAYAATISIAQARALPFGTVVTVDGSVTTPSGAFYSSFFDEGFGLQDSSGGIYVSLQTNLNVAPRRQATVTGKLQDSGFGLLLLVPSSPSDVHLHGAGPKIAPLFLATGAVSEATEGLLVRVVGTITHVEPDLPYGNKVFVNDGSGELTIYINLQTGIDFSALEVGQTVIVTGFSSQFDDHYEIDPRFPADIEVQAP
jgi:hypothetical protein